jgi:hypothetical protein
VITSVSIADDDCVGSFCTYQSLLTSGRFESRCCDLWSRDLRDHWLRWQRRIWRVAV